MVSDLEADVLDVPLLPVKVSLIPEDMEAITSLSSMISPLLNLLGVALGEETPPLDYGLDYDYEDLFQNEVSQFYSCWLHCQSVERIFLNSRLRTPPMRAARLSLRLGY